MKPEPLPLVARLAIAVAAIGVTLLVVNPAKQPPQPPPQEPKVTQLHCAYIGPAASGLITVDAATGDMAFRSIGSSELPDTTLGCPIQDGRVDVSAPGCRSADEREPRGVRLALLGAAVKERPIIFSGPMVRAILEGRQRRASA